MKSLISYIAIILLVSVSSIQSQTFGVGSYSISLENNQLKAVNDVGEIIFEKGFHIPSIYTADLDLDGIEELMINDARLNDSTFYFTLYIFSGSDSFTLIDSIYSGVVEPYIYSSEDVEYSFLVTGNTQFEPVNNPECIESFLPLYCWMFNGNKMVFINDEVYEVFLIDIERLLNVIDINYHNIVNTCSGSKLLQGLLASIYANYIYAYELSNAEIFLKKYYHCDDIKTFKELITGLL